jgi:carboxyl-terminal processing protease
MSLKLRSILVLMIGTVLGLTVSMGSTVLAERESDRTAVASTGLSPEYVELLTRVVERVRAEYVDPIEERRLVENAIRGILGELDPHSKYLPPSDYEEVRISTTGNYSGVGLDISIDDGKVRVVMPLDGAPAAAAGILPGDVLIAVDDVPVSGNNLDATISRMRGKPGTIVKLDVQREGYEQPLQFPVTRADIHVQTVRAELIDERFGYIRLTSFANTTVADLEAAAVALKAQAPYGLQGVVLDLRNNPGGVLEAAVGVADLFLPEGLIVRGSGRARQARFERFASAGHVLEETPLVLLVNAGSASASEIVAGALKDHGRAPLVGAKTYGKGSVQTVMPIGEGSAIKLTTSLYITPSGTQINGIGIEPDVAVKAASSKRIYRGHGALEAVLEDEQLREGLQILGFMAVPPAAPTAVALAADDIG